MSGRRSVLIAFGEALAAPEAGYSVADAGFRVVAACRRGSGSSLRRSRLIETVDVTPPEDDVDGTCRDLCRAANDIDAVAALPLDDSALWILDRIRGELPCPAATAAETAVSVALDKRRQVAAAERAGFRVPTSASPSRAGDLGGWNEYPCILKGALAMRSRGKGLGRRRAVFCRDDSALSRASASLSPEDPVILQSWREGTGLGVFGFRTGGGIRAWSGHHRVRMMNPAGSGSSCCESMTPSPAARASVEKLLEDIGWDGLFMVELLRDGDGQEWFMELNGRVWGSMALARAAGLEYPAWAVLHALGELPELPAMSTGRPHRARHLGREIVHLLFTLRGPGRHAGMRWPKRLPTIVQLCERTSSDRWYNARPGDMGVFRADVLATLREQVFRRSRP